MQKILNYILDFIFPRPINVVSIHNMNSQEFIGKMTQSRYLNDSENKALFDYRNKLTKQAIWEIKYRKDEKITAVLCALFYEFILDELVDKALFCDFKKPIIIPIPISKNRLKERGYNQCSLIVKEIARIDNNNNFTLCENALEKIKDLESQTSVKGRNERLKNIKGCFAVRDPEKIKNANIILIDDVITTGATMSEAKKTLLDAGARQILCFALAH